MLGFGNVNPPNRAKGHIWHYEPSKHALYNPSIVRNGLPKVYEDDGDETDRRYSSDISPSTDEYDDHTPIIGYSQGKKGEDWSEMPTCPLAESNNYKPPWSHCVTKFLNADDKERAIGFWMNLKKTMKGPRIPYVTLQDTIGNSEVLTRAPSTPESPSEEPPLMEQCVQPIISEIQIVARLTPPATENITHRGTKIQTKPRNEARRNFRFGSRTDTESLGVVVPSSRRSGKRGFDLLHGQTGCSSSPHAPSSKKHQKGSPPPPRSKSPRRPYTPPYSPSASLREVRPTSPPPNRTQPLRAGVHSSKTRGGPQPPRVSRRASLYHLDARAPVQIIRPVSRPGTANNRHPPSLPQIRFQEPPKSVVRPTPNNRRQSSLTRPRSPTGNKSPNLRSMTSMTTGMSKICLTKVSRKPAVKKKKLITSPKPIIRRRKPAYTAYTSPQGSRVFPSPVPIRNTGQQTELRLSSISTQTTLVSEAKSTERSNEASVQSEKCEPVLMSRTAQTTPMTSVETQVGQTGQSQSTDCDITPLNSQSNAGGVMRVSPIPTTQSTTSRMSRASLEGSTGAQEGKKFGARISPNNRVSLAARVCQSDSRANLAAKRISRTNTFFKWEGHKGEVARRKIEKQDTSIGKKSNEQPKGSGAASDSLNAALKGGSKKVVTAPTKPVSKPATKDAVSKTTACANSDEIKGAVADFSQQHESSRTTDQAKVSILDMEAELRNKLAPIFNRYAQKERATDQRELVKKPKCMQTPIKDRILGRSNISRSLIKYQPSHMMKNKSSSSVEVRSLFNRKRISKPSTSKESGCSSSKTGQTRESVVKKNLNMLIEACQNLLSEAMKETAKKDSEEKLQNKKVGPSTRETVAWILQTLKNTYGNDNEETKKREGSLNEQECQTSRNLLTPTKDRRSSSRMPSNDKSETIVSSQFSWPDLTFSLNSANRSSCAVDTSDEKNPGSSSRQHSSNTSLDYIPSSLSKGDSFDNDLLHLNCGKFKVALRQVSAAPSVSRLETVKEESHASYTINEVLKPSLDESTDKSLDVPTQSMANIVLVTPMTLPKQMNINPVTRVSFWTKSVPSNSAIVDACEGGGAAVFKSSNTIGDGDFSDAHETLPPPDEPCHKNYLSRFYT